jgi:hypothetical protein
MKENNVEGRFHFCYDNGQQNGFIFLTPAQEKFILEKYPDLLANVTGENE